jgi:hypothetical protein
MHKDKIFLFLKFDVISIPLWLIFTFFAAFMCDAPGSCSNRIFISIIDFVMFKYPFIAILPFIVLFLQPKEDRFNETSLAIAFVPLIIFAMFAISILGTMILNSI